MTVAGMDEFVTSLKRMLPVSLMSKFVKVKTTNLRLIIPESFWPISNLKISLLVHGIRGHFLPIRPTYFTQIRSISGVYRRYPKNSRLTHFVLLHMGRCFQRKKIERGYHLMIRKNRKNG